MKYANIGKLQERKLKSVVITGAASGLGKALAAQAASQGYALALADINLDALNVSVANLDVPILTQKVDVSCRADMEIFAQAAFDRFGRVDMLFNNAGIFNTGSILDSAPESWSKVMDINFFGTLHGMQCFVPHMIASGHHGHVVNIASISGLFVSPMVGAYSVSKHAVTALSETLLFELQKDDHPIDVSVVCPGAVKTNIMEASSDKALKRSDKADDYLSRMRAAADKNGSEPEEMAKIIFDEIAAKKFWIVPNPDLLEPVKKRTASILEGTTPEFQLTRPTRTTTDETVG
jgi:NAD(P)-dependent dehydrogenase (short-subunit alcohol dehydrogenase family)